MCLEEPAMAFLLRLPVLTGSVWRGVEVRGGVASSPLWEALPPKGVFPDSADSALLEVPTASGVATLVLCLSLLLPGEGEVPEKEEPQKESTPPQVDPPSEPVEELVLEGLFFLLFSSAEVSEPV